MKKRRFLWLAVVLLTGLLVLQGCSGSDVLQEQATPQAEETGTKAETAKPKPRYAEYPVTEWELKPGENAEMVQTFCTMCHSLAPIVQHEGFTKEQWSQEVQKMRDRYGAPINDEMAAKITQYLQEQYSLEASQTAAAGEAGQLDN